MFHGGVFHLFPERGLDQSILVGVLVGIWVLLFFTEIFGWVWAGLVVPGYLASVYAVQPAAGIAVSVEAVLTFLIARGVSDVMSRLGGWSPFFGRERFFLIVMVSVVVRQASELWLITDTLRLIDAWAGTRLAVAHDVSSIGLVLVPLVANMFWKLPVGRGLFQVSVGVALTWAVIALVLLPYTNLSFSSFELTYEDVALDFLGSPKAYIILLTTAFVAAHANLVYGWDYNGIMVPSLLALTFFHPWSLVATVGEALVLTFAAKATMALPVLRHMNLEGPRKVTLVFTVGFLLKFVVGWAVGDRWPTLQLSELSGFGYVLTSLMAVKMINLKKHGRVVLPSIAVALVGFAAGSTIGLILELVAPRTSAPVQTPSVGATSERLLASPLGAMAAASVRARPEIDAPSRSERVAYATLWRELAAWLPAGATPPRRLEGRARELGLALRPLDGPRLGWVLAEVEERLERQRGWETAVLYPGAPGPIIEVPRARRDRPVAEVASVICERIACRAIVVSGADGTGARDPADPLDRDSTFQIAHRQLRGAPIVQLRADRGATSGRPRLHVRHALPDSVHLGTLWPTEVELSWSPPPEAGAWWRRSRAHAVLVVHPADLWTLLATAAPAPRDLGAVPVHAWLNAWLARPTETVLAPPAPTELRVLEELVLERLMTNRAERAGWIDAVARTLDHEVAWLPAAAGVGRGAWVVSGRDHVGWIAAAIRADASLGLAIEVAKPRTEAGSASIAVTAWRERGRALLVDAEPTAAAARIAGYLDPVQPGNVATAFQAGHQALYRAVLHAPDAAVIQVRGFAPWRPISSELVVSLGQPLLDPTRVPPTIAPLVAPDGPFGAAARSLRWVDGGPDVTELVGNAIPQVAYAQALAGPPMAVAWYSVAARARTAPKGDRDDVHALGARLGLEVVDRPIREIARGGTIHAVDGVTTIDARTLSLLELAEASQAEHDLAALVDLVARAPTGTVRLGFCPELRRGYVLLDAGVPGGRALRAVMMAGAEHRACAPIPAGPDVDRQVDAAIQARCARIVVVGGRR